MDEANLLAATLTGSGPSGDECGATDRFASDREIGVCSRAKERCPLRVVRARSSAEYIHQSRIATERRDARAPRPHGRVPVMYLVPWG